MGGQRGERSPSKALLLYCLSGRNRLLPCCHWRRSSLFLTLPLWRETEDSHLSSRILASDQAGKEVGDNPAFIEICHRYSPPVLYFKSAQGRFLVQELGAGGCRNTLGLRREEV